jgi:hypothetical protein
VEQLSPRELDSIYRATVAMTLERWPGAYDDRPVAPRRRKILVSSAWFVAAVAALLLLLPCAARADGAAPQGGQPCPIGTSIKLPPAT